MHGDIAGLKLAPSGYATLCFTTCATTAKHAKL